METLPAISKEVQIIMVSIFQAIISGVDYQTKLDIKKKRWTNLTINLISDIFQLFSSSPFQSFFLARLLLIWSKETKFLSFPNHYAYILPLLCRICFISAFKPSMQQNIWKYTYEISYTAYIYYSNSNQLLKLLLLACKIIFWPYKVNQTLWFRFSWSE